MNNKLVSMSSSDYVKSTLLESTFPEGTQATIRTVSDLRRHLFNHLGPLSQEAEGVILLALNDYTARCNAVEKNLVIVSKGPKINLEQIHALGIENRDRSSEIIVKEVAVSDLGATLFIGSISNRAYMTIIITKNDTLTDEQKGLIQNELYAFSRVLQNSYETLSPWRADRLPE